MHKAQHREEALRGENSKSPDDLFKPESWDRMPFGVLFSVFVQGRFTLDCRIIESIALSPLLPVLSQDTTEKNMAQSSLQPF